MAAPFTIELKAPKFAILVARCRGLSEGAIDRAIASALTFTAKDYADYKMSRVDSDIDRPHGFTRRYAGWDGANRNATVLEARAYVRPKQAKYLEYPEFGGVKHYKKGEGGPTWIKENRQDKFGGGWGQKGFQRKWLSKTPGKMASAKRGKDGGYAAGTKLYRVFTLPDRLGKHGGPVTGIWELTKLSKSQAKPRRGLPGKEFGGRLKAQWRTYLIVQFLKEGSYDKPQLHFQRDGLRFGKEKLPRTAQRLLDKQLEKLNL